MKKIFIITILLISVSVGAATTITDIGSTNPGTIGGTNPGNTGGTNPGNTVFRGGSSGSQNNSISSSNSNVPKVSLAGVVAWLSGLINQVIYLILALSLVSFLYGIFKLSFVDGLKPEAREQARKFMFWGIVSLFVMVSVWGLVNILQVSLFGNGPLIIPQLK